MAENKTRLIGQETEYAICFIPEEGYEHPGNPFLFSLIKEGIQETVPTTKTDRHDWQEQFFVSNGGSFNYEAHPFHQDFGLIEGGTPECASPEELVLYQRASESILIKGNKKSGLSAELEAFKDLGIVGGSSVNNTDNEIEILKSRKVIGNVVDSLGLDVVYYVSGRVIESEVYKSTAPIQLEFTKKDPLLSRKDTIFKIKIKDEENFDFVTEEDALISSHRFNDLITSDLGAFKVVDNSSKLDKYEEVLVKIIPKFSLVSSYRNSININTANKNSC